MRITSLAAFTHSVIAASPALGFRRAEMRIAETTAAARQAEAAAEELRRLEALSAELAFTVRSMQSSSRDEESI